MELHHAQSAHDQSEVYTEGWSIWPVPIATQIIVQGQKCNNASVSYLGRSHDKIIELSIVCNATHR